MQDASGTLTIVFNGEIYNCVELRRELQGTYRFQSHTDTEVLLAAYSYWGPDFVQRLNGMFAFAIWDCRRRTLFAARDRFGEKPFYYYLRPQLLLFASEIKAILASGMVAAEPNLQSIFKFLAYRQTDESEATFFKDIVALPPAHSLSYSPQRDSISLCRYWDIDPTAEIRYNTESEYADDFLQLLQQSVKIRLRADVAVGSCLSGGLDSSSIVSLVAAQRNGDRQCTFSARFNDPRVDEGEFISSVTKQFPVSNHGVFPDPNHMIEEAGELVWHQEHPFFGPSIYAQWCVMRLAAESGVTVLLDGQGADESLAGYLASQGYHCRDLFTQLKWASLANSLWIHVHRGGLKSLANMVIPQFCAPDGWLPPSLVEPLSLTQDFATHAAIPPSVASAKFKSALHNALYQQLRCSMLPKLLRFADRSSMAFSREVRLPFLDHRLVEYLFAIPESQKIKNTTTKSILRQAMRGRLPSKVLGRTDKKGFETPQGPWIRGPMRGWIEAILQSESSRQRGWIDQSAAMKVYEKCLAGAAGSQSVIFRWVSLELWAKTFLKPANAFQTRPRRRIRPAIPQPIATGDRLEYTRI